VFRIEITWLKFLIKTRESFDKALHNPLSCSNSFKGFQCCASGFYLCTIAIPLIPRNSTQLHSMPRNSAKFRATELNWKLYSSHRSNQSKVWSDKTRLYGKQISNSKAKSITFNIKNADQVLKDKILKDPVLRDQELKDQVLKDQVLKDKVLKDQVMKDQVLMDQVLKDQVMKDQVLMDQVLND